MWVLGRVLDQRCGSRFWVDWAGVLDRFGSAFWIVLDQCCVHFFISSLLVGCVFFFFFFFFLGFGICWCCCC